MNLSLGSNRISNLILFAPLAKPLHSEYKYISPVHFVNLSQVVLTVFSHLCCYVTSVFLKVAATQLHFTFSISSK